jgi:hypothetical protein
VTSDQKGCHPITFLYNRKKPANTGFFLFPELIAHHSPLITPIVARNMHYTFAASLVSSTDQDPSPPLIEASLPLCFLTFRAFHQLSNLSSPAESAGLLAF